MAVTPPSTAGTPPELAERPQTPSSGLTAAAVDERVRAGLTNVSAERTSRTFREIVRANVFTRFNAILGTMLALILVFGSPADGLFGFVLIANSLIGIVQEYRAKRKLDQLAVLSAPKARAVRDGSVVELAVDDVVLDDLLELRIGDQVPADGTVRTLRRDGARRVAPHRESRTRSSSTRVTTSSRARSSSPAAAASRPRRSATTPTRRKIAKEARRFAVTQSELVDGINTILKFVTWILVIVGPLVFWRQLEDQSVPEAVTGAVGTVVLMVPEGLVLLTSISFGLAALTLARRRVLVQELPAVEGLARVDVVCLDKTGTLTEGIIQFDELVALDPSVDEAIVAAALGAISHDEGGNATQDAIAGAFPSPGDWTRDGVVPFSSGRKWSASSYGTHGAWVLGAPEMVMLDASTPARQQADELAAGGNRVLLLAEPGALTGETLPADLRPVSLVLLEEKVRPDAAQTLAYFHEQGVHLKVISGDNPRTVGAVAHRVGLPDPGEPYDARELPEDNDALAEVLEQHSVFGRVTPHQKRAMVKALQSREHVVAMTGDGVNDALALKDADIGVAMGSGAAATRAVAQLVLLDSEFDRLPGVVAEGRRVIANIERVSQPVPHQDDVRVAARDRDRDRRMGRLLPAPAVDDHQRPDDRDPRVLPRARAQHPALRPRLHQACAAVRDPRRHDRCATAVVVAYALAHAEDVGLRAIADHGDDRADGPRPLRARDPRPSLHPLPAGAAARDDRHVPRRVADPVLRGLLQARPAGHEHPRAGSRLRGCGVRRAGAGDAGGAPVERGARGEARGRSTASPSS